MSLKLPCVCVSGYSLIFKEEKEEGKVRGGDREGLFGAYTHTHSWTSASLRMICKVGRLLKLHANWQHRLQLTHWDTDRTESDRHLTLSHSHTACRCRWHIAVSCPCCFHVCFQEFLCHIHVQPKEGTACITGLASPSAMRRQALRIKTGSESKLGQHALCPLFGLKQHPCWVTREDSRVSAD